MAEEETQEATQAEKEEQARQEKLYLRTPATASWKMSNEDFRRVARTGEFAPAPAPEAEPKQD